MIDTQNKIIRDFLNYIEFIKGKSTKTANEYFLDIRLFFRVLKINRNMTDSELSQISIEDVDINLIKTITLSDIYQFLEYISKDKIRYYNSRSQQKGVSSITRARKISTLRTFFKYLTDKINLLEVNPMQNLDSMTVKKSLPKYLTFDESIKLLEAIDGKYKERDYCMVLLFLSCGMRVSELVNINIQDVREDKLKLLGKGNKERIVYLNDNCIDAINTYLKVRIKPKSINDYNALFTSKDKNRISPSTVKALVKKYIKSSGLDAEGLSVHKLRHTAATLMYSNGVDIRTLQEQLGHKNLDTTMIYTHIDNLKLKEAVKLNPISNVYKKK